MAKDSTARSNDKPTSLSENGPKQVAAPTIATEALKDVSARFGEIVALMMRSPTYRHLSLADLDWLVVPALLSGQFSIMSARGKSDDDLRAPVGVAFWASVSPEVDAKLEAQKKAGLVPFRLQPKDWKSGEIIWLLDLISLPQVNQAFLDKLSEGAFKGKTVKHYHEKRAVPSAAPQPESAAKVQ